MQLRTGAATGGVVRADGVETEQRGADDRRRAGHFDDRVRGLELERSNHRTGDLATVGLHQAAAEHDVDSAIEQLEPVDGRARSPR